MATCTVICRDTKRPFTSSNGGLTFVNGQLMGPSVCSEMSIGSNNPKPLPCYINQLPTEILIAIFSSCLDEYPFHETVVNVSSVLWQLGRVCGFWRNIVSNCMSSSWAYICVPDPRAKLVPILQVCLQRCQKHQLSFLLGFQRKVPLEDFRACLDIFLAACERWQEASLTIPTSDIEYLETRVRGRLLSLETLKFIVIEPGYFSRQVLPNIPIRAFETAPRLERIDTLLPLDKIVLPLSQLTTLSTHTQIKDTACLPILAPNLKHLVANDLLMTELTPSPDRHKVVYPTLTTLELTSASNACLGKLSFPLLEELVILSALPSALEGLTIATFPSLKRLRVGLVLSLRSNVVLPLFAITPSISSLTIDISCYRKDYVHPIEQLFAGLTASECTEPLLPNLTSLEFPQFGFSDDPDIQECLVSALIKLVRSRWSSGHSSTRLMRLVLTKYSPQSIFDTLLGEFSRELVDLVDEGMEVVVGGRRISNTR
ncbi:hypothetical protein VKT23_004759 [Stygiomarasmius scandens]|uniref:F-box domain-containing protein n=1 Tax=Marasmiellus scandens TaxID=2682957 RepID=A0ABR1JXJ6_9AGAR